MKMCETTVKSIYYFNYGFTHEYPITSSIICYLDCLAEEEPNITITEGQPVNNCSGCKFL